MFDTHCHLNFSAFKNLNEVVHNAHTAGVHYFVIPGTDFESSKKAVEITDHYEGIYAAIGIHPHHIFKIKEQCLMNGFCEPLGVIVKKELAQIEKLLTSKKIVAIGEIGIDRHIYQKTKYQTYKVDEVFIEYQKAFLKAQIDLAIQHKKSIILHNREAKDDLLNVLREKWDEKLDGRVVFHCCEADGELLDFAKNHKVFIGIDGDITYDQKKQGFIKKIPLELLVLETDSPFLLPEPLKSQKVFPNEPKNLSLIAGFIAEKLHIPLSQLIETSTKNAQKLFTFPS